jgi:hypothetical protein
VQGPKREYTRNKLFGDLFSKGKIDGLGLQYGEPGQRMQSTGMQYAGAL